MCVCETGGREGAWREARGSPNMASEDAVEDLPGDQSSDSLVPLEQSDTESSVGYCNQHRPQHGRLFLSIPYRGPSVFCQLPCSLPVKTLQIICDFSFLCAAVSSPAV